MTTLDDAALRRLSQEFEEAEPQEIIAWAAETFCPALAVTSSFQTQSLPLLHMIAAIRPRLRVFFIDTGMHFWETLLFREHLEAELGLNVVDLYPDDRWRPFLRNFGRRLPLEDPNLCCYLRKVQPLQKAMSELQAWISGIRRDQTAVRARAQILERHANGLIKVNPLLNWTRDDIEAYRKRYNLPAHPLLRKGYPSVGCAPCTRPVAPGTEDERAGRWVGQEKRECGLHTEMFDKTLTLSLETLATPEADEGNC